MRADTNELISLEDTVLSEGLEALKERRRLRTITAEQEMAKRGAMIYEYDRRKRMAEGWQGGTQISAKISKPPKTATGKSGPLRQLTCYRMFWMGW